MKQVIDKLINRILMLVATAIIERVDDSQKIQKNQVSVFSDDVRSNIDRFQQYGFSSVPVPGCQAILICPGGSKDRSIVIATDDERYRPTGLNQGEAIMFNHLGDYAKMDKNGRFYINVSDKVYIDGDLEVTGDIRDNIGSNSDNLAAMRSKFNAHTHPGDSGGTTGTPSNTMG